MKLYVCEIDTNGGKGRQKIYWDDEEKMLRSDSNDDEKTGIEYRCETPEKSVDIAFAMWGWSGSPWNFVWTLLDGTPVRETNQR